MVCFIINIIYFHSFHSNVKLFIIIFFFLVP